MNSTTDQAKPTFCIGAYPKPDYIESGNFATTDALDNGATRAFNYTQDDAAEGRDGIRTLSMFATIEVRTYLNSCLGKLMSFLFMWAEGRRSEACVP